MPASLTPRSNALTPSKIEPNRKRRKTGGRQKGSRNKATKDIKALAQKYGPEAVEQLVTIMRTGDSDAVRKGAADSLLDRAYGKAPQALTGEGGGPVALAISWER